MSLHVSRISSNDNAKPHPPVTIKTNKNRQTCLGLEKRLVLLYLWHMAWCGNDTSGPAMTLLYTLYV